MNPIRITRHKVRIRPNPDRVITKPFKPGEETFPDGQSRARVIAFWLDSWHMSDTIMSCEGTVDEDGAVEVGGFYAAPPGPDWGWTIRVEPTDDTFRLLMHNVSPQGESALAVEAAFARS